MGLLSLSDAGQARERVALITQVVTSTRKIVPSRSFKLSSLCFAYFRDLSRHFWFVFGIMMLSGFAFVAFFWQVEMIQAGFWFGSLLPSHCARFEQAELRSASATLRIWGVFCRILGMLLWQAEMRSASATLRIWGVFCRILGMVLCEPPGPHQEPDEWLPPPTCLVLFFIEFACWSCCACGSADLGRMCESFSCADSPFCELEYIIMMMLSGFAFVAFFWQVEMIQAGFWFGSLLPSHCARFEQAELRSASATLRIWGVFCWLFGMLLWQAEMRSASATLRIWGVFCRILGMVLCEPPGPHQEPDEWLPPPTCLVLFFIEFACWSCCAWHVGQLTWDECVRALVVPIRRFVNLST